MIRMGLQGGRKFLMAKDADNLADRFETENTGGVLSGFLAGEDEFDRRDRTAARRGRFAANVVSGFSPGRRDARGFGPNGGGGAH